MNKLKYRNTELHLLFRRCEDKYIKSLFERGEIYINTIDSIRKYDDNEERSDPFDSMGYREFLGDGKIQVCDLGKDFEKDGVEFSSEDMVVYYDTIKKGNIYCFGGLYSEDLISEDKNIELEIKSLGKSLIVITNPKEFIKRIHQGLKDLGYECIYHPVEYYPNDYTGQLSPFYKLDKFKSQKEFRFFIPNAKNDIIKFEIGSLENIATIFDHDIMFKFETTDGRLKYMNVPD